MKKALFLGVTNFDFQNSETLQHLKKKYECLNRHLDTYVLAKGKPFYTEKWGTSFYLLPNSIFWIIAPALAFYLCITKRIDVIIAQSPLIEGVVSAFLKMLLRKKLIVEIHGDWKQGPFLSRKRRFAFLQKKLIPFLAKISFNNADKIRSVAEYLTREAKKIAPNKKYFIFPTFTDLDSFLAETDLKFENVLLSAGQLAQVKGMDILIEAFAMVKSDFKLVIAGEGPERKNLESKIKELGLENKIELKGRLPLNEVKNIMKNCYCFVLASLSEGLPRVLMEAMSLKKPLIASRVGGIPDLIRDGENGFTFEPGNINQLADKLKMLIRNKDLAISMGQKGRLLVQQKYSNENYIKGYVSMIYG
jgi:glycosyltransferase involved in cell wall biosynthesis